MEEEARSVFVLVQYYCGEYRSGLYEIKIQPGGQVMGPTNVPIDHLVTFFDTSDFAASKYFRVEGARLASETATVTTQLPGSSSNSKLYLMLNEGLKLFDRPYIKFIKGKYDSYRGFIFDTSTRALELDTFPAPLASKPVSFVMSAYGKLYNLASPVCFTKMPKTLFECYNPKNESWESLSHFEFSRQRVHMEITGYAVCYGLILVSMGYGRVEVMAFHIESNTWHQVNISSSDAYYCGFRGRAVVVDNTIYALSIQCGRIIAFSLMVDMDDDGRIIYYLEKPFFLPGFESRVEEELRGSRISKPTEYLVHLGNLKFCLLQTVPNGREVVSQELFITTFEIVHNGEMHVKTLDSCVRDLSIEKCCRFNLNLSFALECEDHEPKKEEIFQLPKKKGTAKKNAFDSEVHDVGIEGYGGFMDPFIFMQKLRKRVVGNWHHKFDELSRPAAIPLLSVFAIMTLLIFVFCVLYN